MKGQIRGNDQPNSKESVPTVAPGRAQRPATGAASSPIDDAMLREYLGDALTPAASARVEKALRESAELRARLEDVRQNRTDGHLHTLGAIWRRSRLTCPDRQKLGSFLLDALAPDLAAYLTFHLEVVECPFCQANLADLKAQTQAASASSPSAKRRRQRIFDTGVPLLGEGKAR
jgi:hypothetical protein